MAEQPQNTGPTLNRSADQLLLRLANEYQSRAFANQPPEGKGKLWDNPSQVGQNAWGGNHLDGLKTDPAFRAKYYPTKGETYDQWADRLDKDIPGMSLLLGTQPHDNKAWGIERSLVGMSLTPGMAGEKSFQEFSKFRDSFRQGFGFADPNNPDQDETFGGPQADKKKSAADLLEEYGRSMLEKFDENDPYVKQVIDSARRATEMSARNRGIEGGLQLRNVGQQVANASTAVQMARQAAGANALQGAESIRQGQAAQSMAQYNQAYQAQLGQLQQQYQGQANLGRTIGGIAGGVIGALPAVIPGLGAGVAAVTAPALSALGSGIGGSAAGPSPYLPYQPPGSSYRPGGV